MPISEMNITYNCTKTYIACCNAKGPICKNQILQSYFQVRVFESSSSNSSSANTSLSVRADGAGITSGSTDEVCDGGGAGDNGDSDNDDGDDGVGEDGGDGSGDGDGSDDDFGSVDGGDDGVGDIGNGCGEDGDKDDGGDSSCAVESDGGDDRGISEGGSDGEDEDSEGVPENQPGVIEYFTACQKDFPVSSFRLGSVIILRVTSFPEVKK